MPRTLIAFLYHESSARQHELGQQQTNLEFFVRQGVVPAMHNPEYHFSVVLTAPCVTPALPTASGGALTVHDLNGSHGFEFINFKRFLNARWCGRGTRYGCSRLCTGGDGEALVDARLFDFFVLIPDTVRGPFLPNYVRADRWPDLLTGLLSDRVKLVGPSINCHGCDRDPRRCRSALHSEGHLMATDRVGLRLLTGFWKRPRDKADAIGYNEMGSTRVLLDAGFNLGSLQLFWRDHDFQDVPSTQRKCGLLRRHARRDTGGLVSCTGCHWNDTDLDPLEILFVHRSVSFDKTRRREVGATPAYTAMKAELAQLEAAATKQQPQPWPRRAWTRLRDAAPRGGGPRWCRVACPAEGRVL
jgi:hypothetical protein